MVLTPPSTSPSGRLLGVSATQGEGSDEPDPAPSPLHCVLGQAGLLLALSLPVSKMDSGIDLPSEDDGET